MVVDFWKAFNRVAHQSFKVRFWNYNIKGTLIQRSYLLRWMKRNVYVWMMRYQTLFYGLRHSSRRSALPCTLLHIQQCFYHAGSKTIWYEQLTVFIYVLQTKNCPSRGYHKIWLDIHCQISKFCISVLLYVLCKMVILTVYFHLSVPCIRGL